VLRLTLAVILTVLFVGFSLANAHHVEMSLVFGKPIEIRLIFLLGSTFALGAMSALIWTLVRNVKRRRRAEMKQQVQQQIQQQMVKWEPQQPAA